MSVSEKLHELRISKGVSQKELADSLGVAQSSVNYWEKGQRDPSITVVKKIAEYFGVSMDYLMEIDGICDYAHTIAAHFDGDEYTEEELAKIKEFAEFVKSQRKVIDGLEEVRKTLKPKDLKFPDSNNNE